MHLKLSEIGDDIGESPGNEFSFQLWKGEKKIKWPNKIKFILQKLMY